MKPVLPPVVAFVFILGCAAFAVQLTEVEVSTWVATDSDTGQPILRFLIWLEYEPVPFHLVFSSTWTTFVYEGSTPITLGVKQRPERESPGVRRLYSSSPWIVIEPGKRYGATFHFEDVANGVAFDRTFDYLAPIALPTGIRLRGWDGLSYSGDG